MSPIWMSIEVFDGAFAASRWADAHGDSLTETALVHGACDWSWHRHSWGVIFEVSFTDEAAWERFRLDLAVVTALEAVPDPVSGLIVYRGRGGSAGRPQPRRPRPLTGSGAAALPVPQQLEDEVFDFGAFRSDLERRTLTLAG
ncbi:MAG: hypothetical protein QOG03_1281 [Actinomycetota bacterium]|jgi:hypothetical protein|nr:hypothetical protein [Actinomycetota bacterium]